MFPGGSAIKALVQCGLHPTSVAADPGAQECRRKNTGGWVLWLFRL